MASSGARQHLYRRNDDVLGGGDDRHLLPARLSRAAAGRERADVRAGRERGSGGVPGLPALPPVPDRGPARSGCARAGVPCGPADHRGSAGHRDRDGARGQARGLAPAPAAVLHHHLGITPGQLAMSRRAHFARRLLDDTDMAVGDVAFASGFTSLRQFNRQMREVFLAAPSELRTRRRRADRLAADGGLTMRLPFQPPFGWDATAAFFASRAVPGVESVSGGVYRRTISLDGAPGVLEIHPGGEDHLLLRAHLPYWEGLIHVAGRAARMAGTGARPDVRAPGAWGPFEAAVQAVVIQECVDPGQARAQLGRIAERFGPPLPGLTHGLARLFPSAAVLAAGDLAGFGLPPGTARTLTLLAAGVATGQIALGHGASH